MAKPIKPKNPNAAWPEPDEPGYVSKADAIKDTPETQSQVATRVAANEPTAPENLEKLFQTENGAKFASMPDLLDYILTLYDKEGSPEDKRSGDLRDTRFMRALYTFYTFLEKENFFGKWPTGEVYPSGLSGDEYNQAKVKFDPASGKPAFDPNMFYKLFEACEQFFTVAPGLSDQNRNRYIKGILYGFKRDVDKRGEEYGFNNIIKWLNNMYLAGRGESVMKGGVGLPRPKYEGKLPTGLYLYEDIHNAYASLVGTLDESVLARIAEAHKRGVWLGLVEGYSHISPESDPRADYTPESGYDSVAPETTPPSAVDGQPEVIHSDNHMDCPNCGAHLEVSIEDIPTGPSPLDKNTSIADIEKFFSDPDECAMESTGADFAPTQEVSRDAVLKSLKKKEGITGTKGNTKLVGGDKKPAAPKK